MGRIRIAWEKRLKRFIVPIDSFCAHEQQVALEERTGGGGDLGCDPNQPSLPNFFPHRLQPGYGWQSAEGRLDFQRQSARTDGIKEEKKKRRGGLGGERGLTGEGCSVSRCALRIQDRHAGEEMWRVLLQQLPIAGNTHNQNQALQRSCRAKKQTTNKHKKPTTKRFS